MGRGECESNGVSDRSQDVHQVRAAPLRSNSSSHTITALQVNGSMQDFVTYDQSPLTSHEMTFFGNERMIETVDKAV